MVRQHRVIASWRPASISALAALCGSLVGTLGSSINGWIAQRHQIGSQIRSYRSGTSRDDNLAIFASNKSGNLWSGGNLRLIGKQAKTYLRGPTSWCSFMEPISGHAAQMKARQRVVGCRNSLSSKSLRKISVGTQSALLQVAIAHERG